MKVGDGMNIRDIVGMLARHRLLLVRWTVIGMAVGLLVTLVQPQIYQATARVAVDRIPPEVILSQGFTSQQPAVLPDNTEPGSMDAPTVVALAKGVAVRDGAAAKLAPVVGARSAQAALKPGRLIVEAIPFTTLVAIHARNRDPRVAVATANALAASLIDTELQGRRRRLSDMRQTISRQLGVAEARLTADEEALAAFEAQHVDVQSSQQTAPSLAKLAELRAELVDVQTQRSEAEARIAATRDRLSQQTKVTPVKWVQSPLIAKLESDLANEQIELSGLSQQFTPKYPAVADVLAKIDETKRRLSAEMARSMQPGEYGLDPVYEKLFQELRQDEVTVAALTARERGLSAAIGQYEHIAQGLPAQTLERVRLSRDAKDAEQVYQILSDRLHQVRVAEASVGSTVRVVDPAVAGNPLWSRWLRLAAGALLGMGFGLGAVLVKEQVNDPLRSAEDAERLLDLPVLGAIPRMTTEDRRVCNQPGDPLLPLVTTPAWYLLSDGETAKARRRAQFAEAFKYLRTNLCFTKSLPPRTILVTSPGPGEEKETVAANLAIALARGGQRVWLIEGDLRKPALDGVWAFRDVFQNSSEGLTGFLSGEAPLHQVLVPTFVENLWFLPAGRVPSNPSELLGNPQLREMLMQQLPGVDTIIIDAPPVLPVTDAAIMAPFVNAVLLVCNVGTTPRSAAARARQQLEAVGGEVLGVVATGLPIGGVAAAYDSYYADYFGSAPFPAWQVPWVETDPSKMLAGPTVDARYTLPPGSVEGKIVDTGGAGTGGPDARGSRPGG